MTSQVRLNVLYVCLIVLLGGFIYANSVQNPFIYDDNSFIVHNHAIQNLSNVKAIVAYHPRRWVGTLTFALNYAWGGLDVRGYHVFNILIHICSAWVVGCLFCLILSVPKFQSWTFVAEKENLSFWAALLFVAHPVQTMAVDHITQRYAILAALFYLSSLCFYFKGRLSQGRGRFVFFLASGVAGLLGIFTRETVITLPLAILLCEFLILDGFTKIETNKKKYLMLVPVFIVLIVSSVLFIYRFNIFDLLTKAHFYSLSHQGETITSFNYFLTQFKVILIYVRLLFWPAGLNFDYDMPLSYSFLEPGVIEGCLFIILIMIYAVRVRSKYPLISFGIFWFFLTLSVESSIFPIAYVMTEYRLYLPLFGFCVAFVPAMRAVIHNRRVFVMVMGIIVLIFSALTIQRNFIYKDEISLWLDTAQKSPNKSRPYVSLGELYGSQGDYQKSLGYLKKALILEPDSYGALLNMAVLDVSLGHIDQAIAIDEHLLPISEGRVKVCNNLGDIYMLKGDFSKAQEYYERALRNNHDYHETYFNLAHVYLQSKKIPQLEVIAKDILNFRDDEPQELVSLGEEFVSKGLFDMAMEFFSKAVSIDYTYPESYIEMGKFFFNQHRPDDAIHVWQLGVKYTNDKRFDVLIAQVQKLNGE